MEKKYIYALSWLNQGHDDNEPSATTLAVSEDKEKLIKEMRKLIAIDCEEVNIEDYDDEDDYLEDAWSDERNYKVVSDYDDVVYLRHRMYSELYTEYRINAVELL